MKSADETREQKERPTHEAIVEGAFIEDVRKLIVAWREAGKPRKR